MNRPHKTEFSKTEVGQSRKVALVNEDENLAESGQKPRPEMGDRLLGGDPSNTRDLSRTEHQKYQHSQLIKTDDKMLNKLIAFSLSHQSHDLSGAAVNR